MSFISNTLVFENTTTNLSPFLIHFPKYINKNLPIPKHYKIEITFTVPSDSTANVLRFLNEGSLHLLSKIAYGLKKMLNK